MLLIISNTFGKTSFAIFNRWRSSVRYISIAHFRTEILFSETSLSYVMQGWLKTENSMSNSAHNSDFEACKVIYSGCYTN
jgi:hypothetical protein